MKNKTEKETDLSLKYLLALMLLTASALLLPHFLPAGEIELTGMLRSYTAGRLSEEDIPITEQTGDLTLEGWGDISHMVLNPYAYIDADGEIDSGIREAYIDLYFPALDIRIGKQAIIWGQAEGAFITDIVSPQDLRSFILADFSEIRMGVPAVKTDYFAGPFTVEAVWLPRFVPSEQPAEDSIWYTSEMKMLNSAVLPEDSFEDSEVFAKVSYFGPALNAELMAGSAWDDMPVLEGSTPAPDALYKRYTVVGGSFSTTIGSVVLRSEAAAYLDRSFTTIESTGPPTQFAAEEHHQLHGLAGLDWSLLGIDMSGQYILQYIHDHDSSMQVDEFDHTLTFRMRDSYFADTLSPEIFIYAGFDPEDPAGTIDALMRPSLTYGIEEGVEVSAGAEIFLGDEDGKFGRYEDNTMFYVSLRWYF